jgi:hypothetical protein
MALLVCVAGCKKEDRDPPAVALSLPGDGFTVSADSMFRVTGVASDDVELATISATLFESNTGTIVQTNTISVSGPNVHFDFEMRAGDRYTPAGSYSLKVTALDKAENPGSALTMLTIQELPLVYLGAAWAGDQGNGNFAVTVLDTAGRALQGPVGLQNLSDLMVDSRFGQLAAVQSTPGWLRAWDLSSLGPLYQIDLPQGTGATTFTGLSMNYNRYFAALAVPYYVQSFTFAGAAVSDFEQATFPSTAIHATNDRVYVAVQGLVGSPTKIDAYDAASNQLQATYVTDWPIASLLSLGDGQLLAGGNDGNTGKVLVLDRASMVVDQLVTLPGRYLGAATAGDRAWVMTDAAVYELFKTNGTLSSALVTGAYSAIAVDATRDRLFLGGADLVEVRSGAGALQASYTGAYGAVRFIDIHYNK